MFIIIIIIIPQLTSFSHQRLLGVFTGVEWQLIFKTRLSILSVFNNSVIWMVSILPLISPFQVFGDHSMCTNYNWYDRHPHVPLHF